MVGREEASLSTDATAPLRQDLVEIVQGGIAAASAPRLLTRALDDADLGGASVTLIAAGKAAAPMAATYLSCSGCTVLRGLVAGTVKGGELGRLEWFLAGHPLPDATSEAAGRRALEIAGGLTAREVLVVLLSGGASATMVVPAEGITLTEKVKATEALLAGGVPIDEVNCVRKHLSAIKGGRLAVSTAARVITLAISDVVGPVPDDPAVIGSGPTVADPSRFEDALSIADSRGVRDAFPPAARAVLERGCRGAVGETPKAGDSRLERVRVEVIGSRVDALEGAARVAEELGYRVITLDQPIVGEARHVGETHVKEIARLTHESALPTCIVSSGETTVRVTGPGRGGRNQEFVLGAVRALTRRFEIAVLASIGTDGIDGPTDVAGAVADTTTLERAAAGGLHVPDHYLEANNAYAFFKPLGDLIRLGPTKTNVGDLQVFLIPGSNAC